VFRQHTAIHRALELETFVAEAGAQRPVPEPSLSSPVLAPSSAPEPVIE
jgi:hypothetical protein